MEFFFFKIRTMQLLELCFRGQHKYYRQIFGRGSYVVCVILHFVKNKWLEGNDFQSSKLWFYSIIGRFQDLLVAHGYGILVALTFNLEI